MPTTIYAGYAIGVNLENLLDEAAMLTRLKGSSPYQHLGTDTTERTTRVAEMVNRAIEEMLDGNPKLCQFSATQTLASGTATYNLPTDMRQTDILRAYFSASDDDPQYKNKSIPFIDNAGYWQLPPAWRNGEVTEKYPFYYTFDQDADKVVFVPTPNDSTRTVTFEYRKKPTTISAANVASPSAVTISEIPTRFQYVLALRVAVDLARPINPQRYAELARLYYGENGTDGELGRMQRTLNTMLGNGASDRSDEARQSQLINQSSFIRLSPIGGRRWRYN